MVFNLKTFWVLLLTCFLFALITGCSQKNVPVQTADSQLSADELWRLGLEKADARDYTGALADVMLAQKKDPQIKYELAVAHLQFLSKDYKAAVKGYKKLIGSGKLNNAQNDALTAEVDRVKSSKGDVTGRSVAGQWVRAIVAVVAAEEALTNKNYTAAYKNYDKAYQYNSDYTLLLESALAASVAKQWDWAHKKYKEYLAVGGDEIARDMQYRIIAETDRIMALMKGEQVVTLKSLADEIYAERSGEEEADGLPPSMSAAAEETDTDASMAEVEMSTDTDAAASDSDVSTTASLPGDSAKAEDSGDSERMAAQDDTAQLEKERLEEEARREAEADAAREAAREEKRREREAAAEQAKLARERRLALKKEREEKRKAAQEAKKQREAERKAALAAQREAEKQRRAEEKARKAEEKQRLAEERRLEKEARAKEQEIARQEAEAERLEREAEREAEAAKREAEKEKLKEEKRIAAEAAREEAEAKRAAAKEARRQALEERKRLKEEQRLARLARAEEKKRQREEEKRQQKEARQRKAEEKKRKAEERKALAEQKRLERAEEKRIAAEQKRAEQEEKRAEKARKKVERELAKQERAYQKALKKQQTALAKERSLARTDGGNSKMASNSAASESSVASANVAGSAASIAAGNPHHNTKNIETTFDDLLFYAESKSATVRFRAVKELIPLINEQSRIALENRVINDRNIHVRFLAIGGLAERRSVKSLPVLEHALITAATSQERAVLKKAISVIRLGLE